MRGKKLLYTDIFPQTLPKAGEQNRRNTYMEERHDAMACRYYYYANICGLNYTKSLAYLEREFYLAHNTIIQYLMDRQDYIKRMVDNEVTTAEIRKRYPWYDWSTRIYELAL